MEKHSKKNTAKSLNNTHSHNQMKLSLKDTESKFRTIFDLVSDGMLVAQFESKKFIDTNKKICEMLGYTKDELLNLSITDIHPSESIPYIIQQTEKLAQKEMLFFQNIPMLKKNKSVFFADLTSRLIRLNGYKFFVGIFRDVNEYKKSENKLLFISKAIECSSDAIIIADPQGRLLFQNKTSARLFEYTLEELDDVGGIAALYVNKDTADKSINIVKCGKSWCGEVEMKSKSKRNITASMRLDTIKDEDGEIVGIIGWANDISEIKKTGKLLKESETQYRLLADHMKDALCIMDMNLKWTYVSPSAVNLLGYTLDEMIQLPLNRYLTSTSVKTAMDFFSEEMPKALASSPNHVLNRSLELEFIRKNGQTIWGECMFSLIRNEHGKPISILGEGRNITERKQVEYELMASECNFRCSLDDSPLGVRIVTAEGETIYANRAILDAYGYDNIGELINTPLDKRYTPESYEEYLKRKEKRQQTGAGPSEYEVSIVRNDGEIRNLYVFRKDIFWNGNKQYQVIYQDITGRREAEKKLSQTLKNLRHSIKATIQVLGMASEERDPYTAGHHRRVASLARTIARDMGLASNVVEGIRLAGSIHDIGKLSVPSEILSRPTKLNDLEFSLVKEHPVSGCEMLKHVESPWPLAQIVHQHHERIDGSGYPNNLKGTDILIEARIMAVADVVEAMSSHRPYRPAWGIEAALEEIEKNKGTLYDKNVVNTCLKLFREKGYQLL
jgi:PAS domain S-box-containing protein